MEEFTLDFCCFSGHLGEVTHKLFVAGTLNTFSLYEQTSESYTNMILRESHGAHIVANSAWYVHVPNETEKGCVSD